MTSSMLTRSRSMLRSAEKTASSKFGTPRRWRWSSPFSVSQSSLSLGLPQAICSPRRKPPGRSIFGVSTRANSWPPSGPLDDETELESRSLAWSPDGDYIAHEGFRRIDIFEVAQGKLVNTIGSLPTPVAKIDWHPDGDKLAWGGGGAIGVVDVTVGNVLWEIHKKDGQVIDLEWNDVGEKLATAWGEPAHCIRVLPTRARMAPVCRAHLFAHRTDVDS